MIILCLSITCSKTKARDTLRTCNTDCFSMAIMVMRKRLNVTLPVPCLSCSTSVPLNIMPTNFSSHYVELSPQRCWWRAKSRSIPRISFLIRKSHSLQYFAFRVDRKISFNKSNINQWNYTYIQHFCFVINTTVWFSHTRVSVVKVWDTGTSWCTGLGYSCHCEKCPLGKDKKVPHCYVPRAQPAFF